MITEADCKGCGACCQSMGHPWFLFKAWDDGWPATLRELHRKVAQDVAAYIKTHGIEKAVKDRKILDSLLWLLMPARLKRKHWSYIHNPAHDDAGTTCVWLARDGTCKHYEYRPTVCRDFERGGKDCLDCRAAR
jgi:Fe-S-cluster containining protein